MPVNIRQTFLYRTEKSDFYIPVHSTELWRQVQIHLDTASPGETVHVPASRRAKPRLIQYRRM
jgi:hypothetical protein